MVTGDGVEPLHKFFAEMISRLSRVEERMPVKHLMTLPALSWQTSIARLEMTIVSPDEVVIRYEGQRHSMHMSPVCNGLLGGMQHLEEQGLISAEVRVYESRESTRPWWSTPCNDSEKLYNLSPQRSLGNWFKKDELKPFGISGDADGE